MQQYTGPQDSTFAFDNVQYGSDYDIEIVSLPTGQACTVNNGEGQVLGDVTDVTISCENSNHIFFIRHSPN